MMKKINGKAIGVIALAVVFAAALIVSFTDSADKNMSGTVVFTDSAGKEIGKVKLKGDSEVISAAEDGYYDYIKLAAQEASELYISSATGEEEKEKEAFYENISVVKTNFDSFYFDKIKEGISTSELESDTPFASVIVDGKGRVLASYGFVSDKGKTYSTHKTYAGSSIKPLSVYAPAIESGAVNWSSPVKDAPIKKIMSETEGVKEWPSNASGTYTNENMLLCDALYKSINTVAVRTLKRVGVDYSMNFLSKKLGLDLEAEKRIIENSAEDEIYGNIALGYLVSGVSPLEMAGYYQIFMNGGQYTEPYTVVSLTDKDGNSVENKPETKRVISSATASLMARMLEGVVQKGGTAKQAAVKGVTMAGKSGTSDNYYDNWFIGFTPKFVCSVWHGFNDKSENSAPAIFGSIISQFPETNSEFMLSREVVPSIYCNKSGGIKGKGCYDTSVGYYLKGKMPSVCKECGK